MLPVIDLILPVGVNSHSNRVTTIGETISSPVMSIEGIHHNTGLTPIG